jgi:hypothetical protein
MSNPKRIVGDDLPRKMFWRDKAGRGWYWEADELGEHRLFNRSGDLAARINELAAIDRRTGEPGDFRDDTELQGQAVLCVQTAKKPPVALTQNQPPKTGEVAA